QAEDGIRACHVTGVQTCALPISAPAAPVAPAPASAAALPDLPTVPPLEPPLAADPAPEDGSAATDERRAPRQLAQALERKLNQRSEERRVGKECTPRRAQ